MKIVVFGATGGVGGHIVQQALAAGHTVTAVVRDASRYAAPPAGAGRLTVATASVTDAAALVPVVQGCDAVLSGIGPRRRADAGIAAPATKVIVQAMQQAGVRRIVVVSAAPLGPLPPGEAWLTRAVIYPLLCTILRAVYADLAEMESVLTASDLDWTSIRPPQLTQGPVTGTYRTAIGANLLHGTRIPRADVAHAMLAAIGDASMIRQTVGVAT